MQEVREGEIVTGHAVGHETLKSCVCCGIAEWKTSRLFPSLSRVSVPEFPMLAERSFCCSASTQETRVYAAFSAPSTTRLGFNF